MDNITLQVGVKVLVKNSANQYLFLYKPPHASKGFQDKWDIPGGRIIPGTDLLTNLRREIVKEVGDLTIADVTLISAQDIIKTDKNLHVVRLTYAARLVETGSELMLSHEHTEYKWMTIDQVMQQQKSVDPYLLEILASLIE